jgi:hypothetical protein
VRRLLLCLVLVTAAACSDGDGDGDEPRAGATTTTAAASATTVTVPEGTLPLGDGKTSTAPRKGYVFSCQTSFPANAPGAFRAGPWIDEDAKTWTPSEKIAVQGSVPHESQFDAGVVEDEQRLFGNGLPKTPTGVFPIAAGDPAYQYDRNPNAIQGYQLQVVLPSKPAPAAEPSCVGGTIGVSVLGVPIYSAFDAGGRDAVAREVQDSCDGHPQRTGQYHFHGLSRCLATANLGFDPGLFGWALDGYGIYAEEGVTADDLDACHGRTSEIIWQGQRVSMYHYVATADFPYLVGCFHGTPIRSATGLNIGPT